MAAISYEVLMAISWSFTALAILLSAGRFGIRCKIIRCLSWDDAAHLLGLLLLIAQISVVSKAASIMYRLARKEEEDDGRYEADHQLFIRLNVAGIFITWFCLYAIKISFLLLYRRIFQISTRFIQAWWIVLGVVFLTFWVLIAGSLTECGSPLALEHIGTSGQSIYCSGC